MCPFAFAVTKLGFKYLATSSSDRLGHSFKKPFHKAFNREDILGLHIAMATAAAGVKGFGDCGARAIAGPACDWSLVVGVLASSSPWEVYSCV